MNFLLVAINAKYIHSNPAVYSLRSYAGENACHVQIAEYTINNRLEDILEDIYAKHPDAVGISCYIWNWNMVRELLPELHKLMPALPIWLGGPEVTYEADKILKQYPMLTGIMAGEGEETFKEVLACYVEGRISELSQVRGLVLPDGTTGERLPMSMTEVPFLYEKLEPFQNRIIYYESQRGCPFRCSYCLSSIDKTVRFRDISVVKQELQYFLDKKVEQVKFVDRTFNCNHEHAMAIWQYIYEHDNDVTNFHFEIAGDIINQDELRLLGKMRPGLVQLEIGVQSVNPQTLMEIRRVMDIDKLKAVTATIKAGGNIHQHLDLIAGLPYEDYTSFGHSFDAVYAMGPDELQLGFLKVLKGSYMYEMAEEYGVVYMENPPYEVLYTKWLSYEEVRRLKRVEEMVELYYNSGQFTQTMSFLVKVFESPFAMYEALADFYEEQGYFKETPSRVYRYQVLLSFAEKCDEKHMPLYRELLTYDLYLRENAKSRPEFAADLSPYREEITAFYKKEEEDRNYLPDYTEYDSRQLARMTHMEYFTYPVWVTKVSEKPLTEKTPVLFDYQNRGALNHEARTVAIAKGKTTRYVCLDLETTGLNPKTDRIIEIGAVRVEDGKPVGTFQTFVNPGRLLEDRIVELTGITDEDLKEAPHIEEVLPKFLEFLGEDVLMGHSVLFDFSFVKKAALNQGFAFERQGIDTLKIARKFLPELESRSLDYLCVHFRIPHQAHRALEDAIATSALYNRLWEKFGALAEGKDVFAPEKMIYQVKKESPITPAQKERLYKLLEKHKLKVDYDLDHLTRNEASRYTDQILAKYGR